jgi:HNH endonuclease
MPEEALADRLRPRTGTGTAPRYCQGHGYRSRNQGAAASGIVSRCRPERLREPLCDLRSTQAAIAGWAAHIITDGDEQLGQPVVSNGLPLTKIHHAAFDAHLIGIHPDYQIHVSDRLLEIRDGPFLETGLKGIVGQVIQLPRRCEDRPDRD